MNQHFAWSWKSDSLVEIGELIKCEQSWSFEKLETTNSRKVRIFPPEKRSLRKIYSIGELWFFSLFVPFS